MEAIPFIDLRARNDQLRTELDSAIAEVVESGQFVGGSAVERFEEDWASYCGAAHCIGVGNGLDAIRLLLLAHGIGPGDEVLVPAQTFIATWLAVAQCGATPVGVDIEATSGNMDPNAAAAAINSRTVAILVVHLHGQLADMAAFRKLAKRHHLLLLEDAAQAHGAMEGSVRAGALADGASFSFYPTKNLGAIGDAGAITVKDAALAERLRSLRSYGASPRDKYEHLYAGWNSRLDPIQAAALKTFLPKLEGWNELRRAIADRYVAALSAHQEILVLGLDASRDATVWHHFAVLSPERDSLRKELSASGVATDIHYPILPSRSAAFADHSRPRGAFPNAERHASQVVSLPMHPWLEHRYLEVAERLTAAMDRVSR